MSTGVYVLNNGKISEADGMEPKDALLFAPSDKSSAQLVSEQRAALKLNTQFILARFAAATRR